MSKVSNVWVFSDIPARLAEVIGGAREFGEKVFAFVLGGDEEIKQAFNYGADEVYHLGKLDSSKIVESYARTMASAINTNEKSLLLMPNTRRCKALASLLGVELNAGVVSEVSEVVFDDNGVKCAHMVYGGLAVAQEIIKSNVAIVVVTSGAFSPLQDVATQSDKVVSLSFIEGVSAIKCIERRPKESSSVDLGKAKHIVAIGRGISKQEDIKMAEELCSVIKAELGCSRPIAEGEKWMKHERYIGISSVMVKPDIYFAVGISGQIQHMVGAKDSKIIIAINKDKNAPIFEYADYGIVGDLYKVMPALVQAFKS